MIYRVFLLLLAAVLFSGCADINTATIFNSDLEVRKGEVKGSINRAIEMNNSLVSVIMATDKDGTRSINSVSTSDRLLINNARARQAIMFEKAKRAIAKGSVSPEHMLNIWEMSVDSYVDFKVIANKYTKWYSPEKLSTFNLYEAQISDKGVAIEEAMLKLNNENVNYTFNLIMDQAAVVNEMIYLVISDG